MNSSRRRSVMIGAFASAMIAVPSLGIRAQTTAPATATTVTFVQWTDPHLFDAGAKRHGEGVYEEALDNRAAFAWAALETNRQALVERRAIDFVVITGDFGLENVELPKSVIDAHPNAAACPRDPRDEGPIERIPLAQAADEVARVLSALVVKQVYLVPGDHDVCGQTADDLVRWASFVKALTVAVQAQGSARAASLAPASIPPAVPDIVDLTSAAAFAAPPTIHGVSLLGLNDVGFKQEFNKATNAGDLNKAGLAITSEVTRLSARVQPGGSFLIFTHLPDAKDPTSDKQVWNDDTTKPARAVWDGLVARPATLAVFAGHLHGVAREVYQAPMSDAKLTLTPSIAGKFFVAPPLAGRSPLPASIGARGILLATASTNGRVTATPLFYATVDPGVATPGDDLLVQARAFERDGQWETAAQKYEDVLKSATAGPRTRTEALASYVQAREQMRSWWWRNSFARAVYLNGVTWANTAWMVIAVVLLVGALRFARFFALLNTILKFALVPRFSGSAVLNPSVKVTGFAPDAEFSTNLFAAGEEVRRRLLQEQENWAVRHINLLAPASGSFDALLGAIPTVSKVDVGSWAKFFLALAKACRWNVDNGVGVFQSDSGPAPSATADLPPGARISAYASLQWGWMVKNSWRRECVVVDRSSLSDLARQLAELILGEAFV